MLAEWAREYEVHLAIPQRNFEPWEDQKGTELTTKVVVETLWSMHLTNIHE